MVRSFIILLLFFCGNNLFAQGKFDRRIIIEKDTFYAVEINNETQVAKLFIGDIHKPIDSAAVFALPAGTKRRNQNFLPFAWTLYHDTVYCINFTEYAQNSHINSLKSIPVNTLEEYNANEKPTKNLMQAAYANKAIINLPLIKTFKKYVYMDDLYFDIQVKAGIVYQFICVKNELTVWSYKNSAWEESEVIPFKTNGFFSVFEYSGNFNVVSTSGDYLIYPPLIHMNPNSMIDISNKLIVENRDSGEIHFISSSWLDDISLSLKEILERK
ncbi:MAG: hypothetical protein H7Y00_16920 [Fimbriimonadaceae bacterium]|nr:hypothetical protein [Chitinophagales bacterium]